MQESLAQEISLRCNLVEAKLQNLLPSIDSAPATIHQAMYHSLFAGGKRIRPVLVMAASEALGGDREAALYAACAVELIHTYSLVHDDLPCMDDDDLRRGKPTCHVVYGEGVAVLAGDALLTAAFEVLAKHPANGAPVLDMVRHLAVAAGSQHLIGGQVLDLEGEQRQLSLQEIERIHAGKTAALLGCCTRLGAMSAKGSEKQVELLAKYGFKLGMAFQVIDDILDATTSSEQLGKTAGKDEKAGKSTFVSLLGIDGARDAARKLTAEAMQALEQLDSDNKQLLVDIADYLLERNY